MQSVTASNDDARRGQIGHLSMRRTISQASGNVKPWLVCLLLTSEGSLCPLPNGTRFA